MATSLALATALYSNSIQAEVSFSTGSCAIVVASRQSVSEARDWVLENRWQKHARIFLSQNGWYSIAVDVVSSERSSEVLNEGKASGLFPQDAYCSTGRAYLREIAWRDTNENPMVATVLGQDFDARPLSRNDKAFLQSALAFEGLYVALIDGEWGRSSQAALEKFAWRKFQRDPTNAHAAYLALSFLDETKNSGWRRVNIGDVGYSLVAPMDGLHQETKQGAFSRWVHDDKELAVIFNDLSQESMKKVHMELFRDSENDDKPYTVRKPEKWITSAQKPSYSVYLRSDLYRGTWSTVMIVSDGNHHGDMALIASSIRINTEGLFLLDQLGVLRKLALLLEAVAANQGNPETEGNQMLGNSRPEKTDRQASTGTGFFVNESGVLLTNAHVIEDCMTIEIDGQPAEVLAVSSTFDLAALGIDGANRTPLPFATDEIRLNADITIAGYPLHGLLGGLNISRGAISAMKGLNGDEITLQISAPVQPGNSGGPMVDQYGNVVGVVVSKLNALKVANLTGDISQNVNFAIRGSMAKTFMNTNGIRFLTATEKESLYPEEVASRLKSATRLIECAVR